MREGWFFRAVYPAACPALERVTQSERLVAFVVHYSYTKGFFAVLMKMIRSVTPPPLQGPSSKEKKYDRQLRLWAASGQQALEEAHVLLVNSGPGVVGIEALKNLILPGIGDFTIVDDANVTEADLGVNFFLDEDSLGQSRAEESCKLLLELNPDVTGNHMSQVCSVSWQTVDKC